MTSALDKPENEPTPKEEAQVEISLNESNAGNADMEKYQRTQMAKAGKSASSVESGEFSIQNNLEEFQAKLSNTLDMENVTSKLAENISKVGGALGTQGDTEDACPRCVTDWAAGHRGGTLDYGGDSCSKCEDQSITEGKGATKHSREQAGSEYAADSSAGGKNGTQGNLANRDHAEAPDIVSSRKAVTEPSVHDFAMRNKDAEIVSVTELDVATLTDSDAAIVSASDPDVTMRTVSDTDTALNPVSSSLKCRKCHSQPAIDICGVHTIGSAQRMEASAFALTPHGFTGEIQGFSVAPLYPVLQASPGMQMYSVSPSGPFQPRTAAFSCSFMPMPSAMRTLVGTTSTPLQLFGPTPPPYLTQGPWQIQMNNMPPTMQPQLHVNQWLPNSVQALSGFQMHNVVEGTQRLPSVAVVTASGAIFRMQLHGDSSYMLQPSIMTAPPLQLPVRRDQRPPARPEGNRRDMLHFAPMRYPDNAASPSFCDGGKLDALKRACVTPTQHSERLRVCGRTGTRRGNAGVTRRNERR
ncbi:hypothetical protein HPB51_023784 [Rhipicephalus microplus]|uniref:Uncharacterized protein n=1 Tax=Rhipicephalus microplus TaxID=6941 RepID=A0A9J6E3W5_RHIMP|nr:hypothetical protein HPB51_023784 [Rhipicephalus microplus]